MRHFRRLGAASVAAAVMIVGSVSAPAVAQGSAAKAIGTAVPAAIDPNFMQLAWERELSSNAITTSSPGVGVLDGQGPSVIVGSNQGIASAFHVSDGSAVAGWPYRTNGVAITSTPSTTGTGASSRVLFGIGTSASPSKGGYLALNGKGDKAWSRTVSLLQGGKGGNRGVMGSMAIGNMHYGVDAVGGSMGQQQLAMSALTGKTVPGWPWLQADTNFSTPALARIFSSSKDYVIEGGDSTAGRAYQQTYKNGGHIRILRPSGNASGRYPNDGLVCQLNVNQVVQSSPAVGRFLGNSAMGVVVGTGVYYQGASSTNRIFAMDTHCNKKWQRTLDGNTLSSPALAELTGDGTLDVVANSGKGTVYALNGPNGYPLWTRKLGTSTVGGPTTFQVPGKDYQYVLVAGIAGLYVLDGRNGSIVHHVEGLRLQNSATVTADPDGSIGITIAGAKSVKSGASGYVRHYKVTGTSGVTSVQTPGAWPMFHHDPQLTGFSKQKLG